MDFHDSIIRTDFINRFNNIDDLIDTFEFRNASPREKSILILHPIIYKMFNLSDTQIKELKIQAGFHLDNATVLFEYEELEKQLKEIQTETEQIKYLENLLIEKKLESEISYLENSKFGSIKKENPIIEIIRIKLNYLKSQNNYLNEYDQSIPIDPEVNRKMILLDKLGIVQTVSNYVETNSTKPTKKKKAKLIRQIIGIGEESTIERLLTVLASPHLTDKNNPNYEVFEEVYTMIDNILNPKK